MQGRATHTAGFTLVELLMVIAIIGILAAMLIPNLIGSRDRAYDAQAMGCNRAILTAQMDYRLRTEAFTADLADLDQGFIVECRDVEVSPEGPPGRSASGTRRVMVSGEQVRYLTWHQLGSASYRTDTATGQQVETEDRF